MDVEDLGGGKKEIWESKTIMQSQTHKKTEHQLFWLQNQDVKIEFSSEQIPDESS